MVIPAKGFWIEGNNKYSDTLPKHEDISVQPDYANWELEHYDHMANWFSTYFSGQDYLTVCGKSNDQYVLITIKEEKSVMPEEERQQSSEDTDNHSKVNQYRVILRRTTVSDDCASCNLDGLTNVQNLV
jgi:hypothetical protein